jgi:hypothetical protein
MIVMTMIPSWNMFVVIAPLLRLWNPPATMICTILTMTY